MRPVRYARYMTMFDRIEMNVIDVTREVLLIADNVFPEATLPDASLALLQPPR